MLRTLVVDDEPDILDFVVMVLERAGHEVVACSTGGEALAVLERQDVDVVVADYHMPGLSGADICRHLASTAPTTRVLLMSGDHDAWTREDVADICAFLPKPFNLRSLTRAVESLTSPTPSSARAGEPTV